jgi:RHS repeat-associated protein
MDFRCSVALKRFPMMLSAARRARFAETTLVLLALCCLALSGVQVHGQGAPAFNDVSNQTQPPVPGVGHDYQNMLGETVNFANGSVSFKISFPVAKSRGLTLPYEWSYNSAAVNPLNMVGGNWPTWDAYWTQSGPMVDGWDTVEGIPLASVAVWSYAPPPNQYQTFANCNNQSGMTFTDSAGVMHNLNTYSQATSTTASGVIQVCGTQSYTPPNGDGQVAGIPDPHTASNYLAGTAPQSGAFIVIDKSGTVYSFGGGIVPQNGPATLPVQGIEDKNGNFISFPGQNGALYTDTSGRQGPIISATQTISFVVGSANQTFTLPTTVKIGNLTYTAAWTTLNVNYTIATHAIQGSVGCRYAVPTTVSGTRVVLSSLTLPNGKSYSFEYNDPYGLVSQISYPDGGYVQYSWQLPSSENDIAFWSGSQQNTAPDGSLYYTPVNYGCGATYQTPVLESRTVSFDGSTAQTQTFSYSTNWYTGSDGNINGWNQKTTQVTTTDEKLNQSANTNYTYVPYLVPNQFGASGISGAAIPMESEIDYYDWGQSSPMRIVKKTWYDQFNLASETTTLPSTGKMAGTIYSYGSGSNGAATAAAFTYLLEKDEYDYGSGSPPVAATSNPPFAGISSSRTPTRKTIYNYSCCESLPSNIYSGFTSPQVPLTVPPQLSGILVEDGSGNVVSATKYGYDGTSLATASAAQHDASYGTTMTARGNLTSVTRCSSPSANCTSGPTVSYTYDVTGQPRTMTDGCGNSSCSDMSGTNHTTTYDFADSGTNLPGNSNAYLTSVTHPTVNGVTLQENYQYDYALGYLTGSQDANGITNGKWTTYKYTDVLDRLTEVDSPDGGQIINSYNDSNASTTTTRRINATTSETTVTYRDGMFHNVRTQLTSDPDGTDTVDTRYDGEGRVYTVSNPYRSSSDGTVKHYYDALGRPVEVQEQDGSVQQWCYDGVASTPAVVYCSSTQLGSSNSGSWVDFTDENANHWERVSDFFGNLTKVMEPSSVSQTPSMETDYSYDVLQNLTGVTQRGDGSSGAVTRSFSYDGLSRLAQALNPEAGWTCYGTTGGAAPNGSNCIGGYDANGNLGAKTDGRGITITYTYDVLNRLKLKTYSDGMTPVAAFGYDGNDESGNPLAGLSNSKGRLSHTSNEVDAASNYSYDSMGRVLGKSSCIPGDCNYDVNVNAMYDYAGNLQQLNSGVPSQSFTWTYAYQGANRLSSVTGTWNDAQHPGPLFSAATYDPKGGLSAASIGTYSSAPIFTVARTYDNRARVVSETDTTNKVPVTAATPSSGNITISGSEQSKVTAGSSATATLSISGSEQSSTFYTCPMQYGGCPVTVYDSGSYSVSVNGVSAGGFGWSQGATNSSLASSLASAINGNSNSPVTAMASGSTLTITSKVAGPSGNYSISVTRSWSSNSYFSSPSFSVSAPSSMSGGTNGPTVYDSGTISVTINNNTASATWNSGSSSSSIASALATAIRNADQSFLTANTSGSTISLASTGTGSSTNWAIQVSVSYDTADFSSSSFSASAAGMSGGTNAGYSSHPIYSFSIPTSGGYDGVGNLKNVTDLVTGTWAYTYDPLNRLQTGTPSSGPYLNQQNHYGCWAYDGFGNRTAENWQLSACPSSETSVTPTASFSASNRVTWTQVHAAVNGFMYDGAGNVTNDNAFKYLYDGESRICAVQDLTVGTLTAYIYDALGNRVAKGTPSGFTCSLSSISVTTRYIVGINGEQLSEENGSGTWVHTNVFADGKLLATYEPNQTYFAMTDWLGTKRGVVAADGTQLSTDFSLPYGNQLSTSGSAPDASEHHFTGKERDAETGFANGNDYFGARYYASSMGRFMSPDWSAQAEPVPYAKLDDPQTLNLYAYVMNNPLTRADVDGHAPMSWGGFRSCGDEYAAVGCGAGSQTAADMAQQSAFNAHQASLQEAAGGGQLPSGSSSPAKLRIPLIAAPLDLSKDGKHIAPTHTLNSKRGRYVDYGLFELNGSTLGWRNRSFTISLVESYVYGHADEICDHSNCSDSSGTLHDVQTVNGGNAYAVKREWFANGVRIPVWNPTDQKPAQYEILHLQFQSEFTMEYK